MPEWSENFSHRILKQILHVGEENRARQRELRRNWKHRGEHGHLVWRGTQLNASLDEFADAVGGRDWFLWLSTTRPGPTYGMPGLPSKEIASTLLFRVHLE